MIRLEEAFVGRVDLTDDLRHCLEELLDMRWSSYRKSLKRCGRRFSEKNVHALRVDIRRMLSTLALLGAALPGDLIVPLERELKVRLKALSRLRDTHVQLGTIAAMMEGSPELEPLRDWLRRKERRLARRLECQLAETRAGKAARRVSRLRRALHKRDQGTTSARNLEAVLVRATGRAFDNVMDRYRQIRATNVAAIHRTRVAFKKFRYMVEALSSVLPGIPARQLRAMHSYQTRMGEIQDVDVLIARAEKFAKKGKLKDECSGGFCQELLGRRARLIRRFVASADRLLQFWPPTSRHVRPTRRMQGAVAIEATITDEWRASKSL